MITSCNNCSLFLAKDASSSVVYPVDYHIVGQVMGLDILEDCGHPVGQTRCIFDISSDISGVPDGVCFVTVALLKIIPMDLRS